MSRLPSHWDETADFVVLGSGSAGLTGAVVAATEGCRVILVEKADVIGGTTSVSGGGFWIPGNRHMAEVGVDDSRDEALEYVRACAPDAEPAMLEALIDNGPKMVEHVEDRLGIVFRPWPTGGGTIDYRPELPGSRHGGRSLSANRVEVADLGEWGAKVRLGSVSSWTMDPLDYYRNNMHLLPPSPNAVRRVRNPDEPVTAFASGSALVAELLMACVRLGVDIRLATPAEELLQDDDGRVVGVRAHQEGSTVHIRATRGVLVATGGFGQNEELKSLWLSRPLDYTCEVDSNQGDGHLMGMAAGAQVAGLGDAWWIPYIHLGETEGVVNAGGTREDRILPHTMIVNSSGRRFVNEAMNYYDFGEAYGLKSGATPRNLPGWFIFDEQGRERYMLLSFKVPAGDPPPWLTVAHSIEELAAMIDVDGEILSDTFTRFNQFARTGVDEDFHRGESGWDVAWGDPENTPNPSLGTIEKPPFYAMRVHAGALATRGGLRINPNAQVMSAARPHDPIPGLYAAGNVSSGGVPGAYAGPGATIGGAMTFGYIAAKHAASKASPRTS